MDNYFSLQGFKKLLLTLGVVSSALLQLSGCSLITSPIAYTAISTQTALAFKDACNTKDTIVINYTVSDVEGVFLAGAESREGSDENGDSHWDDFHTPERWIRITSLGQYQFVEYPDIQQPQIIIHAKAVYPVEQNKDTPRASLTAPQAQYAVSWSAKRIWQRYPNYIMEDFTRIYEVATGKEVAHRRYTYMVSSQAKLTLFGVAWEHSYRKRTLCPNSIVKENERRMLSGESSYDFVSRVLTPKKMPEDAS